MSQTDTQTQTPSKTTGASVRVRGVVKKYRDSVALDHVDLDIEEGEFLTLLGSSGSGKSTLLNIVAGFIDPDSGSVEVDGTDITRTPPYKRGLGVVFQHYALFPHMSVFDNVAFPLRRRKTPKAEVRRQVREALATVELGHLEERMPAQLSGGQQQRVALARAIVFRPRVLLMDEPLGALDKRLREQLQLEIKRLHHELSITFVFVTHDQEEALVMSDRIALLRDGQVVQVGTPQELYERPAELYTAEFLGESNIFRGRIEGDALHTPAASQPVRLAERVGAAPVAAALMVRPERIDLCPAGQVGAGGTNRLPGRLRELIYLGSGHRAEVELTDGTVVIARTPADRGPGQLTPGQSVDVCWQPEHGMLLTDRAAPQPA